MCQGILVVASISSCSVHCLFSLCPFHTKIEILRSALSALSLVASVCLTALLSLSVIPPPSHATGPLIQSLAVRVAHYQLCFNSSPTVSSTLTDNIGLCVCVHVCESEILF